MRCGATVPVPGGAAPVERQRGHPPADLTGKHAGWVPICPLAAPSPADLGHFCIEFDVHVSKIGRPLLHACEASEETG
jgi:hypothetical protein